MAPSCRSNHVQHGTGLLLALVTFFALFSVGHAILINPSLEDHYTFSTMVGPTDYSFFVEHPPVLSEDEEFLLVLTRENGEIWLNMFRTSAISMRGVLSKVSLTQLIVSKDLPKNPVKLELHALPNANYILNYMYFDGEYTVSYICVLAYARRPRIWTIVEVLKDEKLQPDYRKLGHVKPVLGEQNMPWNLRPTMEGKEVQDCRDVIYFMEDDVREFVLCPFVSLVGGDGGQANPQNAHIEYRPYGGCFQYVPPWYNEINDTRHIVSVVRQDDSGIITMVNEHDEYTLMYMGTLKNCPKPHSQNDSNPNFNICTSCVLQCIASGGAPAPLQAGNEAPELLVPDTGMGRFMAFSCSNTTTLDSEPYPPWLPTVASTEVTNCVFTVFEVSDISHEIPIVPIAPPLHPEGPVHHLASKTRFSPHAAPAEDPHHAPSVEEAGTCRKMPPIPWMRELVVTEPLTLTLAANRTVRMSYNGDLLYATHFTRDGISSVSILDMSNGGAFEQGSLPLNSDDPHGPIVNSFSDDIDMDNEFLYVCGFFFNYSVGISTPAIFKYNVAPRGQPSMLSQIYIESQSGTTPTSNYMVPVPQLQGIAVVAAPREVIIKQVSASSLELAGEFITYQYTSSQVLDINVVRPVLSKDGTRILVFCQTLGLNYTNSILSAYIIDIILTPLNDSDHQHGGVPFAGAPHDEIHHFESLAQQLDQDVRGYFGANHVLDKEELKKQYESFYETQRQNRNAQEKRNPSKTEPPIPRHYSRRDRTTPHYTSSYKKYGSAGNNMRNGDSTPPSEGHPSPQSPHGPVPSGPSHGPAPTPSNHEEPPTFFPPQQAQTPLNMSFNITLEVQCRFWISNNSREAEVPIGASFVEGSHNELLILAFTTTSVGFEETQMHIYNLSSCRGANVLNDDPIDYSNLTMIPPLATAQANINWDSLPFADEVTNSNQQSGDSSGVRFWDIPTYRLNDNAIVFWFSNQSLNVGIGDATSHPQIDPADYSSTLLQFVWNGSDITHVATSAPIECSPITSQVVPAPTPVLPQVPVNQTTVWVICQSVKPHRPSQVIYSVMAWHLTAPSIPDMPLIPWNMPPDDDWSDDREYNGQKFDFEDDSLSPQKRNIPMNAVHNVLEPHPNYVNKRGYQRWNGFEDVPDAPFGDIPFFVNDSAVWFLTINSNITLDKEVWDKSAVMNFYVQWEDRRVYYGNAQSYHIIAITYPKDRAVLFGRTLFTTARLVNSIMAWSHFPGFGFLSDVQWIWVVSECTSGTTLAETGYCSKCRPGTFGLGCGLCTPGYMCDGFGLLVPSGLCIEGSWCGAGTTRYQQRNPPQICRAGTYCPGGVASPETGKINSARLCGAGYYCPEGSSVPNPPLYKCNQNSTSNEGAASIEDCLCDDNYFGTAGQCRPVFTDSLAILFGKVTKMWYPTGWYPAGHNTEEGVQYLEQCHLNPGACNGQLTSTGSLVAETYCEYTCEEAHHNGGGHHKRIEGGSSSVELECKIECDDATVCQNGYEGRVCSKCAYGFYERGHICSDCNAAQLNRKTTIAFIVIGALIVAALLALVVIGQAFIALVLELLSMVLLNSIGLVPIWTLDVLLIFVLVYFINRGKRYNSLMKIQEERAAKRRLRRRAKRMAQKRREARIARSARLASLQRAPKTPRMTMNGKPTDAAIRATLGLPSDAQLDPSDPVVQDAVQRLERLADPQAMAMTDEDAPLPVIEDFVALPSEEEDYFSEGPEISDYDDDDDEMGRELSDLESGSDSDADSDSESDLSEDHGMDLPVALDDHDMRALPRCTSSMRATGRPTSTMARRTVTISTKTVHPSQRSAAPPTYRPTILKSSKRALESHEDGPAATLGPRATTHFDQAFLHATGHLPNEAHAEHKDFIDEPGHDDPSHHGDGHDDHGDHEHEPEYISEGLIKSFLFYLQTTEGLSEGLYKWQELVLNLQEFSPFSQIASFDCVYPALFSYQGKFIMYMILLPVLTLVMVLMYLLGVARMTWQRRQKLRALKRDEASAARSGGGFFQMAWANEDESTSIRSGTTKAEIAKLDAKRSRLRYRWARIWLFFVSVFYFELTEGILKVFRCEEDAATELTYMESQPWVVCDTRTYPYRVVYPLAVTGLIVYSLGIPCLFFYLLYRHRKRLHSPKVMSWLGMLYEEYQPHLWWFEMTMILRRVLIALIISVVPSESEFGSIGIMMVLMSAMACNVYFRAFVSDTENSIDLAAMCVMMITYIGGVVQKAKKDYADLEAYRRNPGIVIQAPGSGAPSAPLAGGPQIAVNNISIEAAAYAATWRRLPPIEIFIFSLNIAMFLVYLGALLSPRLLSVLHWCQHRYRDWKQRKEDDRIAEEAERNAHINILQTDDEEASDLDNPSRPLLRDPRSDF